MKTLIQSQHYYSRGQQTSIKAMNSACYLHCCIELAV